MGCLLTGEPNETIYKLKEFLVKPPPFFATVGDFVSMNILNAGLSPNLIIVDNRTMRAPTDPIKHDLKEIQIKNNAATISAEAIHVIKKAITLKSRLAIVVEGEEDLLVLPLLAETPLGSVIAYGQPREGLVVVTVTAEKRSWARSFLKRMEKEIK